MATPASDIEKVVYPDFSLDSLIRFKDWDLEKEFRANVITERKPFSRFIFVVYVANLLIQIPYMMSNNERGNDT